MPFSRRVGRGRGQQWLHGWGVGTDCGVGLSEHCRRGHAACESRGWVPASCQPLSSCGTSVSSRRSGELLLLHYRSVTGRTLLAPTSALRQLVPLSPPPPPPIPLCLPLLPSPLSHHPSLSITLRTGNCRGVKKKIKVSYVSPTPDSTSLSLSLIHISEPTRPP